MLTNQGFEYLMAELGLPERGVRLIAKAREEAPVREVKSTGTNVLTLLASRKMCRSIATESRKVEYVAVVEHEINSAVLEYFPQPGTYKLELLDPVTGEVHAIEHTPDFLVLQKDAVKLQEWKNEERLLALAKKFPYRYQKIAGRWRSPQIEDYFAELGIQYELHSSAEVHPNRTKNIEILFDYFDVDAPSVEVSTAARLKAALQAHGSLSLLDLQNAPFSFFADDLLKLIAEGHVACDLNFALLSDLHNFRVYRDELLLQLEGALCESSAIELENNYSLTLAAGAQFSFDGRMLQLVVVGESDLVFNSLDDKTTRTLSKDWLLAAFNSGQVTQVAGAGLGGDSSSLQSLLVHTKEELQRAHLNSQLLALPYDPKRTPFSLRTYYRYQAAQVAASANGGHEILALTPNHYLKGNRDRRLSDEQLAAMDHIRETEYKTTTCKRVKSVYRELQAYCTTHNIKCPSYPTFNEFIKAHADHSTRVVRGGKRMAYQEEIFHFTLSYQTPRHGVRPFECVHIDHTLVDVELRCRRTGKSLGRPWLTLMIDAFSRRVMAFHLGFNAPGRAEVLMCLRAFVKRWNRIPFITMCDNGKDLVADDVKCVIESLGGHFRRRPKGRPRVGSVMERIFGTANAHLFHNLEGNTKLTREVRKLSGTHLPERLANWGLEDLYKFFEHWACEYYDNLQHPALSMSPREAFEKGLREIGYRPHKMIAYGDEFIIATCPTVDRKGLRKVDRQRGVKVHNFYYQSPLFDSLRLHSKTVLVRFDPNDIGRIFFQLPSKQWAQARSMQLSSLPRLNVRQLAAISEEYRNVHKIAAKDIEISGERLVEFIASMKFSEVLAKEIQLTGETEQVQQMAGLLPSVPEAEGKRKAFGLDGIQHQAQQHISGIAASSPSGRKLKSAKGNDKSATPTSKSGSSSGHADFVYGELD